MAASAVTTTSRTACEPFSRQLSRHSGNTSTVSSANVNITTIWPMTSSTVRSGAFSPKTDQKISGCSASPSRSVWRR